MRFFYHLTMKIFELSDEIKKCETPEINSLIQRIELYRGMSFSLPKGKEINRLHERSQRWSTTSSNAIESIKIDSKREEEILGSNVSPSTYEEFMIRGYNDALSIVFSVYKYQSLDEDFICRLHKVMYEGWNPEFGGSYKYQQNYIKSKDVDGNESIVFTPPSAEDTRALMGNLLYQFNLEAGKPTTNRLVLVFDFILNFLCIHPFQDGNGRVSRLLTTFLLLKLGYELDQYYSLSYLILNHIDDYYSSLNQSDQGWKENRNDPVPFVSYSLLRLLEGYQKLNYILKTNSGEGTCADKCLGVINDSSKPISKADIEEILYSYSRDGIEKALKGLVKDKKTQLVQRGRYSLYYKL